MWAEASRSSTPSLPRLGRYEGSAASGKTNWRRWRSDSSFFFFFPAWSNKNSLKVQSRIPLQKPNVLNDPFDWLLWGTLLLSLDSLPSLKSPTGNREMCCWRVEDDFLSIYTRVDSSLCFSKDLYLKRVPKQDTNCQAKPWFNRFT